MDIARPVPGWSPSTPDVLGPFIDDVMRQYPTIAIHFWASWNGADPLMDRNIRAVQDGFAGRVHFASCNVDNEVNGELLRRLGVVTIPTLGVLVSGTPRRSIVGCVPPYLLAAEIESRLREPMPKPWWTFWRGWM